LTPAALAKRTFFAPSCSLEYCPCPELIDWMNFSLPHAGQVVRSTLPRLPPRHRLRECASTQVVVDQVWQALDAVLRSSKRACIW